MSQTLAGQSINNNSNTITNINSTKENIPNNLSSSIGGITMANTGIHSAVKENDLNLIKKIIQEHGSKVMNEVDDIGQTPLHVACFGDDTSLVEFLVKQGSDINCTDNNQWTPLHCSCSASKFSITEFLLSQPTIKPAQPNNQLSTPLHYFVRNLPVSGKEKEYLDLLELLVSKMEDQAQSTLDHNNKNSKGSHPIIIKNSEKSEGTTPHSLSLSTSSNDAGSRSSLVESPLPSNSSSSPLVPSDSSTATPSQNTESSSKNLCKKCSHTCTSCNSSSSCQCTTCSSTSPSNVSQSKGESTSSLVKVLSSGINFQNSHGETAVHSSLFKSNIVALDYLVNFANACLSCKTQWGETPLHYAARQGSENAIKILLNAGVSVSEIGDFGTAYDVAKLENHLNCLPLLDPSSRPKSTRPVYVSNKRPRSIWLRNGPKNFPPRLRRIKHIKRILGRNLGNQNELYNTFFTIHEDFGQSTGPAFYTSEVILDCQNPGWRHFNTSRISISDNASDINYVINVWNCNQLPISLLFSTELNLCRLGYLGELRRINFPPNTIVVELTDGYYASTESMHIPKGAAKAPERKVMGVSYTLTDLSTLVTLKKALSDSQENLKSLSKKIEHALAFRQASIELTAKKESCRARIEKLKQELKVNKEELSKESEKVSQQKSLLLRLSHAMNRTQLSLLANKEELNTNNTNNLSHKLGLCQSLEAQTNLKISFLLSQLQNIYQITFHHNFYHQNPHHQLQQPLPQPLPQPQPQPQGGGPSNPNHGSLTQNNQVSNTNAGFQNLPSSGSYGHDISPSAFTNIQNISNSYSTTVNQNTTTGMPRRESTLYFTNAIPVFINGLRLPSSGDYGGCDEEQIATALGYVCHIVFMISKWLNIPLRFPVTPMCSRSLIRDEIGQPRAPKFPLYSKGAERQRFEYGVYLLNRDIEQLCVYRRIPCPSLRQTLANLYSLITEGEYRAPEPPQPTHQRGSVNVPMGSSLTPPNTTQGGGTPGTNPNTGTSSNNYNTSPHYNTLPPGSIPGNGSNPGLTNNQIGGGYTRLSQSTEGSQPPLANRPPTYTMYWSGASS